jgi:hypothetical protein
MRCARLELMAVGMMAVATAAFAKGDRTKSAPPELYGKLSACRAIAEPTSRLACFDAAAAKLDIALATNEVYMVDKAQVRETRKTLFGLPLPNLGLFGSDDGQADGDANRVVQLDSAITSVGAGADGWIITIAEGSVWKQTDGATLALSPKIGMKVVIKRAALGSYKMNVGGQPAVRVKRVL